MGRRDSSKTRVQPVLRALLQRDPLGTCWLGEILALAGRESPYASRLAKEPGNLIRSDPADCFERKFAPAERFLRWLLQNPHRMQWPTRDSVPKTYGEHTQRFREDLMGRRGPQAQQRAMESGLAALRHSGAQGSERKAWAFEGFTHVDCCLATDRLLLFIEGKRTDVLASATDWFPSRNQLARNLEVAKESARGQEFAVLLIVEHHNDRVSTISNIAASLPHYSASERANLSAHFLGTLLWNEVCEKGGVDYDELPDTI